MKYEFKSMAIAEVEWVDSNGMAHWQSKDDMLEWAKDHELMKCRSAGYVLLEDDDCVVLVLSESPSSFSDGMMIPRVSITKISYLSVPETTDEKHS